MRKTKKIFSIIATLGAISTTSLSLISCGHSSTLTKINDNAQYLFGGQGIFKYNASSSTWTTTKKIGSGNYIAVVGNSGATTTWKMLYNAEPNAQMGSDAHTWDVATHKDSTYGGFLPRFLSNTMSNGKDNAGQWLASNHISVILLEYKALKNGDLASSSKAKDATKFTSLVSDLKANEQGSLAFIKGSSLVKKDKDKHIDPSKAVFSNPAQPQNDIWEQIQNIFNTPKRNV